MAFVAECTVEILRLDYIQMHYCASTLFRVVLHSVCVWSVFAPEKIWVRSVKMGVGHPVVGVEVFKAYTTVRVGGMVKNGLA